MTSFPPGQKPSESRRSRSQKVSAGCLHLCYTHISTNTSEALVSKNNTEHSNPLEVLSTVVEWHLPPPAHLPQDTAPGCRPVFTWRHNQYARSPEAGSMTRQYRGETARIPYQDITNEPLTRKEQKGVLPWVALRRSLNLRFLTFHS